ncbi:hypothetical protein B0J12DRAFT_695611 [Macrophomina phaseolina]|uniref:Uncharacterized protein n=1 Tax=Macrophomina phaseolina TaxID=35725 RepID=A0ABQ8GNZ0_9PEZI|nr:hypothetical protein B0J12DRAFT_695611 [Macrophomina phaseolina]
MAARASLRSVATGDREELGGQRLRPSSTSKGTAGQPFPHRASMSSMSSGGRDWQKQSSTEDVQGSCRNRRHRACCRPDARTQALRIVGLLLLLLLLLLLQGLAGRALLQPAAAPMSLSLTSTRPGQSPCCCRAGWPTTQRRQRYREGEDPLWPSSMSARHRVVQACKTCLRVCMYAASLSVLCLQHGPASVHASSRMREFSVRWRPMPADDAHLAAVSRESRVLLLLQSGPS